MTNRCHRSYPKVTKEGVTWALDPPLPQLKTRPPLFGQKRVRIIMGGSVYCVNYVSLELLHCKLCQINTLYHLNDSKIKVRENNTPMCVILPHRSSLLYPSHPSLMITTSLYYLYNCSTSHSGSLNQCSMCCELI